MSAYKLFNEVQFLNGELLVEALRQLGLIAQCGEAITLRGWGSQQTAQIVVSREQFECGGYDLGFQWNGQAFVPIIEDYMARTCLNEEWRRMLQDMYAKLGVLKFLGTVGAEVGAFQRLADGSLAFSATVEVKAK